MKYNSIKDFDMKQGDGINVSLWTQGCPHRCKGCHNPETWDCQGGKDFTDETIAKVIELLTKDEVHKNLSILGGEPLMKRNIRMISKLVTKVKQETDAEVWIWTGYMLEDLFSEQDADMLNILFNIDYLVDGKFIEEQKQPTRYKGSSNQRVIDMKASWLFEKVVQKI